MEGAKLLGDGWGLPTSKIENIQMAGKQEGLHCCNGNNEFPATIEKKQPLFIQTERD